MTNPLVNEHETEAHLISFVRMIRLTSIHCAVCGVVNKLHWSFWGLRWFLRPVVSEDSIESQLTNGGLKLLAKSC